MHNKRVLLSLLISILLLNIFSSAVLADGMILPEVLDPGYMVVRSHHVTVEIEDNYAVTRVVQEFHNPTDIDIDSRYIFPIPPTAALSDFTATVDGRPQDVTRQDSSVTNAVLYDNITRQRDPSLLQYAGWDSFAFDLHLPAGSTRKMVLEYEEILVPIGSMLHYRYILSTERYSAAPLESVSVTVDVQSSAGLASLYSSSHNVAVERISEGHAQVTWSGEYELPNTDFDLFFAPADGGFGSGLLTGRREGQDHFLFLFSPEIDLAAADALPKDIVFVIDRSGSMSGEKIEQARNALNFILGQLNPADRFSIVGFDDQLVILSQTLLTVDRETLRQARSFVNDLYANNSTDLELALQTGLGILERSESRAEAPRLLVFLTDGLPTAGITDGDRIASLAAQTNERVGARLHVFGVGYDVNTHLLDRLADNNGGSVTYVQPGENLELVLSDFYRRIANPVLTGVEVEFEGLEAIDLYPQSFPDLFQGSSLLVSGRYRAVADKAVVRVRGRAGGKERLYTYEFNLAESQGHAFVPRLWATRKVGRLLDQVRVEGESRALVEEIRALGLGYGVVTPYTTFVIDAQSEGAASMENMSLYGNITSLNQVSGRDTVQARVQNQSYQEANQADVAVGSNVLNNSDRSLAQVNQQSIDLSLLQGQDLPDGYLSQDWIADNIEVDRQVTFASAAYFELAEDPGIRPLLQSGNNALFRYQDEVFEIVDPEMPLPDSEEPPSHESRDLSSNTQRNATSQTNTDRWLTNIYSWMRNVLGGRSR